MLIKKGDRTEKQIAPGCTVWEYPLDNKNLDFALTKINGRFPESGKTMNKVCQEIYYIISGAGTLYIDNEEIELNEGDVYLIEAEKKYHLIGENLVMALPTSPAWYPEQQEFSDE
ncbi:MAG: cupin domain-containing protein [archaeon]|nr:cupin domain-containing protein [archaeon]